MFNTRGRKIIGDVLARKARTALVSASIFIGVLGVVALFTVRDLTIRQLDEDLAEDRFTMIDVYVSAPNDVEIDNDADLATLNRQNETGQALEALEGIERVEGLAYYPIAFLDPATGEPTEGEMRAYASLLEDVQLEPLRLLEGGAWPAPGQRQVTLEKRMAEQYGFGVGDEIVFRAGSAEGIREETYTVSGLVFHAYSFQGANNTTGGLGFGPQDGIYGLYDDAQSLLNFSGLNIFYARYDNYELAEDNFDAFQATIGDVTPYAPLGGRLDDPANSIQRLNADSIIGVLSLLALVTMIVSGFLVVNMISTIMAEQKAQIGVIKSIGGGRMDTFFIYAGIAFVYGIIGSIPAVILGIPLGYRLALFVTPLVDVLIEGFAWSPSSVFIGALLGLIVPVLAAAIPVYNGTRVSILDALTDHGISSSYGQSRAARLIGMIPLPIGIRQAVSNIFQKKGRLALTGTTLTLAIGAFMGVIAVGIQFTTEVTNIFDRLGYQILLIPSAIQDFDEVREIVEEVEGVRSVAPGTVVFVQIEGGYENPFDLSNQVLSYSFDPTDGVLNFDYNDGDGWADDPTRDGVVITATMANQLALGAGDDITFVVGGTRVTQEVIGVDAAFFDSFHMDWAKMASLAGIVQGAPRPNEYVAEATLDGRSQAVVAVGLDDAASTFLSGEPLTGGRVLITQSLADAEGLAAGDSVGVTIGDYVGEHSIAAVVQLPPQLEDAPDEAILFNFNALAEFTGVSLDGEPIPNGYFVTMDTSDPSIAEVDELMGRLNEALLERGITGQLQNQLAVAEDITDLISQFVSILLIAAILIAAVGAVGLLTTLTIAVFERQKEIGVMRSIGASSAAIATQFLAEGLLVSLIAWVLAIPVSYGLGLFLLAAFQFESVEFVYPLITLGIGFVAIMALAAAASLGPSLNAARRTVADILRYQ